MKSEHLHFLIDEEIYSVDKPVEIRKPVADSPEKGAKKVDAVRIVFIHDTNQPEELELLNKIVIACQLNEDFKILKNTEAIDYEKAIIFTESADAFYQPTENDHKLVLYSKPLKVLLDSKEEKGKLWKVLQEFATD